ncbi:MAG: hypothetical protein SPJ59_02475 [Peptoniphilaceae bacterium]|nr:hypothetical protein [Peptoniphilaceae bacterium]
MKTSGSGAENYGKSVCNLTSIGRIIDVSKNEKVKNSLTYATRITKHNLKTMTEFVDALRDQRIHSLANWMLC